MFAKQAEVAQDLEKARATGDMELVAKLESIGPELQKRLHEQGFGTAPVDDIISRIEGALPGIAAEAEVDVIVSKWALDYSVPTAQFVDITYLLAAQLDPNERTLKMIQSTIESDPVPIKEIEHEH